MLICLFVMLGWSICYGQELVGRLRRGLRERLGRRSGVEDESATLDIADAQFLLARSLGFESWAQLAKQIEDNFRPTGPK